MSAITELRKKGQLDQAYQLGQQTLQASPNDIWIKREFGWVCYDLMKQALANNDEEQFYAHINEIAALGFNIAQEQMLFENIWWQIVKWVCDINAQENVAVRNERINRLLDGIEDLPRYAPSEAYSTFIQAIHRRSKDSMLYLEFMRRVNLSLLRPEDSRPSVFNDQQLMPLLEQILYAYSKAILRDINYYRTQNDNEKLEQLVAEARCHTRRLKAALGQNPEYNYTLYYIAKLLMAVNENSAAIAQLMPFVRKKHQDFWVWNTLAQALKETDLQTAMSCCCKGLLCKAQEDKMVSLHETAATIFAACGHYNAAKTEVRIAEQIRMKYWQNHIKNQEILGMVSQPDYINAVANQNNFAFYKENVALADQLTFADLAQPVLITYVNTEKKIANFITSKDTRGFFSYDRVLQSNPQPNTVYNAAIEKIEGERYRLYCGQKVEDPLLSGFLKPIQGFVKRKPENQFAFVDNIFISPELVKAHNLQDGDAVNAVAVKSFNRKKNEITWAIHQIISCTKE